MKRLLGSLVLGFLLIPMILIGSAIAQNDVTFCANMRVKILEGVFNPTTDYVLVRGSLNSWGDVDTLTRLTAPDDSLYAKTFSLATGNVDYKFFRTPGNPSGFDGWESGGNRTYVVAAGGGSTTRYFDDDSLVSIPTSGNVVWRVDLRAMQNIGWFSTTANDSVQVRGAFEGWGGTRMAFDPISGLYRVTAPYSGLTFDNIDHKYFIQMDSVSAAGRFPGFGGNQDGVRYDHPYDRGDGNRQLNIGIGGNQTSPSFYFSSIHRWATMNNTTDTCRVTVKVNMGPATREADPFVPGTDSVFLAWRDYMWQFAQVANQGSFPGEQLMTQQGPGDSVYTLSFRVKGKAHAGLMYVYRYSHPGAGGGNTEGGGLGGQDLYRVRFIQPTGHNTFPATYAAPQDSWQRTPPMPIEPALYGITDVRLDQDLGQPIAYRLDQNYPNPFNPSTHITYSIPENARVTLKVFNILGQEVTTLVNQDQTKGNYTALFESNRLSSGVYFYRLDAGKFTETKKMLLMR